MPYNYYADDAMDGIREGSLVHIEQSIFRFANTDDAIVAQVVGDGGMGLDKSKEFMELHFYERDTNNLATSVTVPLTEGFLWLRDTGKRRLQEQEGRARVDAAVYETIQMGLEFWNKKEPETSLYHKYLQNISPGYYNLLINYFSSELGTHNNKNWKITTISPTRRELILEPVDTASQTEFAQFIDESIFVTDFKDMIQNYGGQVEVFVDHIMDQISRFNPKTKAYLAKHNYNEEVKRLLILIFREILHQTGGIDYLGANHTAPSWAHKQELEKNYRITANRFNTWLNTKDGSADKIIGSYIDQFPESGQIFLNT